MIILRSGIQIYRIQKTSLLVDNFVVRYRSGVRRITDMWYVDTKHLLSVRER